MSSRSAVARACRALTGLALVWAGLVLSVWPAAAAPNSGGKPLTILIGLDGFRVDYLTRGHSPTLEALAKAGGVAQGLTPVFPSVTFPNHVSLVTGRRPAGHGIVNNTMWDPRIGDQVFRLRDRQAVTNPAWWAESEPIWVTAARQGRVSSTLFWPGSEVKIRGLQPRDWLPYRHDMSSMERVDHLLGWLTDIRPDRPQADFATLYFSEVDSEGHAHGPDSPAVHQAIARVDAAIARLIQGLERAGLWSSTHLVIAADHGMSYVPADQQIDGRGLLRPFPAARWQWTGPVSGLALGDEDKAAVLAALGKSPHLDCWPKALVPRRFGDLNHPRVPDIICLARTGWSLSDQLLSFPIPGQHGFDPDHSDMQGLLIVHGPRIRPTQLGRVSNLEVYPLLCVLLGIRPAANESKGILVDKLLQRPGSVVGSRRR